MEALQLLVMFQLCRESNATVLSTRLQNLLEAIDNYEPKVADLYFNMSCVLTRLCGGNKDVSDFSRVYLERALALNGEESKYISEMGYLQSTLGQYAKAIDSYRRAHKYDESNIQAINGTIYCRIRQNQLEDAAGQVCTTINEFQME